MVDSTLHSPALFLIKDQIDGFSLVPQFITDGLELSINARCAFSISDYQTGRYLALKRRIVKIEFVDEGD